MKKPRKGAISSSPRDLKQRRKGDGESQAKCQIEKKSQCCHSWKVKDSKTGRNGALDSRRSSRIRKEWAMTIEGRIPMQEFRMNDAMRPKI